MDWRQLFMFILIGSGISLVAVSFIVIFISTAKAVFAKDKRPILRDVALDICATIAFIWSLFEFHHFVGSVTTITFFALCSICLFLTPWFVFGRISFWWCRWKLRRIRRSAYS